MEKRHSGHRGRKRGSDILDLHPARIMELLGKNRLARALCLVDSLDSTNDFAMQAAAAGAVGGSIFIAQKQSKGKGRKGRVWHSAEGKGLAVSILLRTVKLSEGLTAVFAMAVVRALERYVAAMSIKWPNDVCVAERKLCGILGEARGDAVVIGFGLNVNEEPGDFPSDIEESAVSLRMAAGRSFDRGKVLSRILRSFEELFVRYERDGFRVLRPLIERRMRYIGQPVTIDGGQWHYSGKLLGLSDEGYIRVASDGEVRTFAAGDLTLREDKSGNGSRAR